MEQLSVSKIHKEDFQPERVAFFSDAVFAIAITLLIIDIKVPEQTGKVTDAWLWNYLGSILTKLIGFFVSFFVIGLYWLSHHRLFRYVNKFHPKLLWANLLFLLPIILMPFSTAFFSEYAIPGLRVPIMIYTINIVFTGLMSFRLWKIVSSPKYNMSIIVNNKPVRNYNLVRALAVPLAFVCVYIFSFFSGWMGYLVLYSLPLMTLGIRNYFRKKYPREMEGQTG